mmetsp:Transcript_86266/g.241275  ORF Transcript_86266/g.241275 Transcript_86266/m.241275 type:complete len:365 (-) Transcript_86266:1401-2495(-)
MGASVIVCACVIDTGGGCVGPCVVTTIGVVGVAVATVVSTIVAASVGEGVGAAVAEPPCTIVGASAGDGMGAAAAEPLSTSSAPFLLTCTASGISASPYAKASRKASSSRMSLTLNVRESLKTICLILIGFTSSSLHPGSSPEHKPPEQIDSGKRSVKLALKLSPTSGVYEVSWLPVLVPRSEDINAAGENLDVPGWYPGVAPYGEVAPFPDAMLGGMPPAPYCGVPAAGAFPAAPAWANGNPVITSIIAIMGLPVSFMTRAPSITISSGSMLDTSVRSRTPNPTEYSNGAASQPPAACKWLAKSAWLDTPCEFCQPKSGGGAGPGAPTVPTGPVVPVLGVIEYCKRRPSNPLIVTAGDNILCR